MLTISTVPIERNQSLTMCLNYWHDHNVCSLTKTLQFFFVQNANYNLLFANTHKMHCDV